MRDPEIDEQIKRWLTLHHRHFPQRWGVLWEHSNSSLDNWVAAGWYQRKARLYRLRWPEPLSHQQLSWRLEKDYRP